MAITDTQCRAAKPKSKSYKLFDYEGLYLEVMPTGSKIWRLKFWLHDKERRISLGSYPETSLADARKEKLAIKEDIRNGIDPVLKRAQEKQIAKFDASQTFELLAREWHRKQYDQWKPNHAQTVLHRLEKYVFPYFGTMPIRDIKPLIILKCLEAAEKTAPDLARRLKCYCHHIFVYAIVTSRSEHDPTYGLEKALRKYRQGHYPSISVDLLPKFIMDLHDYQRKITRQTFLATKFMFLTFIRTSEMIKAKWEEVDLEKKIWSIPAERMKLPRPHLVPLSRQAVEILRELKAISRNSEYVFPSLYSTRKHMSNCTVLTAIKRMGYKGRMTGHGFRALAMGILKEKLGYSHDLVKKQLAHAPKDRVDAAYDRAEFLPQRTEMMQRYADYLDSVFLKEITARHLPR
ncbi:MAG TPA: integrase arm-type DNA-binding domain-containing protein [Chitinophagaceae bacterium]|nr:integrase arm-type DNA-binding domain-containing protein [Chitinophagaceae bacterium]